MESSIEFADWYDSQALAAWEQWGQDQPLLPALLGQFKPNADVCFVGFNPSFNEKWINKQLEASREKYVGFTAKALFANGQSDRTRRIVLIKELEQHAKVNYSYFKTIGKFVEGFDEPFSWSHLDLYLHRNTSQSESVNELKASSELQRAMFELFRQSVAKIEAKVICVLNAKASTEIIARISTTELVKTHTKFEGKTLIFAGMLSGSRAMDRFSKERLRFELSSELGA